MDDADEIDKLVTDLTPEEQLNRLNEALDKCYMTYPVNEFPWSRAATIEAKMARILKRQKAEY